MFVIGKAYTKKDIYKLLSVPLNRIRGAWDTGYREYEGNIFIFANVGIAGRTGHNYNNYWDGDLFKWEAKMHSAVNQPSIKMMLKPNPDQSNYLFTRINDKDPFTYEGTVIVKEYRITKPVQIDWELIENIYNPIDYEVITRSNEISPFMEGSVKKVIINKYERNPLARRICINHYGAVCNICGFNFQTTYGEWGKDYIHVHHLIPLSEIKKEYILDPIKDLIPVCANCHSIIHRKKKPLSVDTLKKFIQR